MNFEMNTLEIRYSNTINNTNTHNPIECYYIVVDSRLSEEKDNLLSNILHLSKNQEQMSQDHRSNQYIEIGPILNFKTPWSSHVMSLFAQVGLTEVIRIERSYLYLPKVCPKYDRMTQQIYQNPLKLSDFQKPDAEKAFEVENISQFSQQEGLGFQSEDVDYYQHLWSSISDRPSFYIDYPFYKPDLKKYIPVSCRKRPTDVELYDLAQSNSEHSRHGTFRGILDLPLEFKISDYYENQDHPKSLFDMIKVPLKINPNNSLISMKDNSSAIQGSLVEYLSVQDRNYQLHHKLLHPVLTAETHNFPTGIAPFPGAATGTGGRIRDVQAVGRGGLLLAGIAGYCVGRIDLSKYSLQEDFEKIHHQQKTQVEEKIQNSSDWHPLYYPEEILVQASNGASDYGNKMGEPVICGFTRAFGGGLFCRDGSMRVFEWMKPIMFSGGIGQMFDEHVEKQDPEEGLLIVRLGGPAYRIGVGGGAASSRSQTQQDTNNKDFQAVQRDDAEMENRLNKVIRTFIEMGKDNPILSIHDQGAGGMGNVVKEIVSPLGGVVSLDNVHLGDFSLSPREIWVAEYQEQNTILIHPKSSKLVQDVCIREQLPIQFVGFVSRSGRMQVSDSRQHDLVDLDLDRILEDFPLKPVKISPAQDKLIMPIQIKKRQFPNLKTLPEILSKILRHPSVGSKRFLTNKVDRSVTGLVVQQQCVGPFQTPLCDYAVMAQTFENPIGIVTSVGEQPLKMLLDPIRGASMTVGEMLTNLIFCYISDFEDIKCSGNWMFEKKIPEELQSLYLAVKTISSLLTKLGLAIDGGKDSLSMSAISKTGQQVVAPRELVMTSYVQTPNYNKRVTPDLKQSGNLLILVDLGGGQNRLGGSKFQEMFFGNLGSDSPNFDHPGAFPYLFRVIQKWIYHGWVVSGHDRSDGGLLTAIIEMAIAGDVSFVMELSHELTNQGIWELLFNEELGLIFEVLPKYYAEVEQSLVILANDLKEEGFSSYLENIDIVELGMTFPSTHPCMVTQNNQQILSKTLQELRYEWEVPSQYLEMLQCNHECVISEYLHLGKNKPRYHIPDDFYQISFPLTNSVKFSNRTPRVAILREQGSNGEREMANAFFQVGFETHDVTTTDLIQRKVSILDFDGVVFVGGFSYADVLGAGRAWAFHLKSHPQVKRDLQTFYQDPTKFSLGVCNGCQVMSALGWIPGTFVQNTSQRFESRFSTVKIPSNNSIMLKNMENLTFGVWVAHGEGKYQPISENTSEQNICLQFVDHHTQRPTEDYPENPNGSSQGITAICDETGRHLAMMPHPERSIYKWQLPYIPSEIKDDLSIYSPWIQMFQNAHHWCCQMN